MALFRGFDYFTIYFSQNTISVILRNMLENGLKYKDGGKVLVKADDNIVEISNSGVFAKSNGYGFGLMLCNEIAKRVGWGFEINSSNGVVTAKLIFTPHLIKEEIFKHQNISF